jgi:hypothetical protein
MHVFNHGSGRCKKNRDFPDLNPGLVGIPGSGNRESRFGRDPGIRGIGNPDLAGIGKINPDARASGIWWSGTASAYGWTTFPAERQVAAIKMRVGQNGGPLPFEAIIEFGEPIVYIIFKKAFFATKKSVFCNRARVTPDACHNSRRFLQQLSRKGARRRRQKRDGGRRRAWLRLGRAVRREDEGDAAG